MSREKQRRGGTGKRWSFILIDDQDLAESTRYALSAATYHFDGMRFFMDRLRDMPYEGGKLSDEAQMDFNKLYHNLRGFFWELCASFDTLLQEINRRFELGIQERDVDWSTASEALSQRPEHKKFLRKLSKGYNSRWFTEVREYRNFAHRGTIMVEGFAMGSESRPEEGPLFSGMMLRPISGGRGAGEPIALCRNYGKHVDELVRWALHETDRIRPRDAQPRENVNGS